MNYDFKLLLSVYLYCVHHVSVFKKKGKTMMHHLSVTGSFFFKMKQFDLREILTIEFIFSLRLWAVQRVFKSESQDSDL